MDWMVILDAVAKYVLAAVVALLGKALLAWFEVRNEAENARTEAEKANAANKQEEAKSYYMGIVRAVIDTVVKSVGQTLVAGVKGTAEWTDVAKANAFTAARSQIETILGPGGMERLSRWLDNVECWLEAEIEAAVLNNKDRWGRGKSVWMNYVGEQSKNLMKDIQGEKAAVETESPAAAEEAQISNAAYEAATFEATV